MKQFLIGAALCAAFLQPLSAQTDRAPGAAFDSILKQQFPQGGPGAAVLVSRHGRILYQKAVGMANVELRVPMRPDNVFRIGSVTKQFTAIAILQLLEAGKLRLQDPLTRFLPNYPAPGAAITIEQLLTHTSGIRDFTSLTDSTQHYKLDLAPDEMIRYFAGQPLRFAPGTRYEYSNSNYFLLGHIIETITGDSYRAYVEGHFLRPLGMTHSYYGGEDTLVPNRASGYTRHGKELVNAGAISMTQPFAAGALLSSTEDLLKWQRALLSYQLVGQETLAKAFSRYRLADGTESNYGFGWRNGYIQQSPSLWHGGLISGYTANVLYLPGEDVYVVVLSNCDCTSPEVAAARLAALAIGKPYTDREVTLPLADLQRYTGVYENARGEQRLISIDGGRLYSQTGRARKIAAKATGKDHFFLEDPMVTMEFSGGADSIGQLTIWSRSSRDVWSKTNAPLRSLAEIRVDEAILARYEGTYEVSPQFSFTVSREGSRLFLQARGQEKVELFAETPSRFFLKVNDAQLEFVGDGATISKALLKQGGRSTDAIRVK